MWTLLALLNKAEQFFKDKGIPSPRLEAELLLAHSLAYDRIRLYTDYLRPVEGEELDRFRDLTLRRSKGEPSAYLTGKKEFFSLPFFVNRHVLIPRPETEELVQLVLDHSSTENNGFRIADIGTGSGCIPITLLKLRPSLRAVAVDISLQALTVAESNAREHGVHDRIRFYNGNLLHPLDEFIDKGERFRFITCNPPYIDPGGPWPVDREVADFEPKEALFTPSGDPTYFYSAVLTNALPLMEPEGLLIFELGAGLREPVVAKAERRGWSLSEIRSDLSGIERVVAFKPCG
ncbi:MAG: peptide chain release factor N(5)-glutamine methyltransferase [Planctomycetota bacterium]